MIFSMTTGAVPAGLTVRPACRDVCCANPAHLAAVDPKNLLAGFNRVKTHCPRGHEYAGRNLYVDPRGATAVSDLSA